ncbi:ATP-binding protein [Micromonospora arborensis]|uniref:sensor histidine kinase n=1 Tax=Micromonospora arborensis TaxID=2116518 RepID=UPI003435D8F1
MTGLVAVLPAVAAPAAVAVAAWTRPRRWTVATGVTLAAVVVSLAATATAPPTSADHAPAWTVALAPMLVEWCAFAASMALFVHRAPARHAAIVGTATVVAMSTLVLRLTSPPSWLAAVGACALWALAAVPPAALSLLLRQQARRRERLVAHAQRTQRLQLARDLHDFVAHEVSEIIAVAQAGHVIGAQDPTRAADLFPRIEDAGQRAMSSLDRTVHMLDDSDAAPGLADVSDLVVRFGAAGLMRTEFDLDPTLIDGVAPQAGTIAYRIVAEALTNIRRHASTASTVAVAVRRTGATWLTVTVTNDSPTEPATPQTYRRHRGGRGLRSLRALARTAGGRLTYGQHGSGWQLAATLPLAPDRSSA